ncbi:MAG: alpha/beta hydrolase [Pseudomonadota bacterium]|nr:alpha/beta hydrolase [Pseudomonadota bacterium]
MTNKPVPEGQYATLPNGHTIHYLDQGSGTTVVFLHGSGSGACGHSNFKGNYPALVEAGYRVIVQDLIGYGYSDKPDDIDYPLELFVQCVKQTLDTIGVTRCTLVGNSLGGAVAISLALKHPEILDRLVLLAPGGVEEQADYFKMPGMAKMKEVFTSPEPMTASRMLDFFRTVFTVNPDCVDEQLANERHALMQLQNPRVMQSMRVPDMTADLHRISCPALGFWGMQDQLMPETGILKLARNIPKLRMIVVPQCGHWVMIEHRDLFNRMLLDFLAHG